MPDAMAAHDRPTCADTATTARCEDVALLFTEIQRPLLRYLLSLGLSAPEAEDVLQETFLRLCEQFTAGSCYDLRAWTFRVAHNLAFDLHRRRSHDRATALCDEALQQQMESIRDPRSTPEQLAVLEQRFRRLHAALQRLPEQQQFCLHLRAEGLRYREIAEVLGVGVSTVADWVQAALQKLGREFR